MREHVDQARHTMFNQATDTVREQLKAMCDKICEELWKQVLEGIFNNLSNDYLAVLGTDTAKEQSGLTRAERMMRGELSIMLAHEADVVFKDCLPTAEQGPAIEEKEEMSGGLYKEESSEISSTARQCGEESDDAPRGRDESCDLGFSNDPFKDGDI